MKPGCLTGSLLTLPVPLTPARRLWFPCGREVRRGEGAAHLDRYERHGLKASFNAEVMQSLYPPQFGADNPALQGLAREREECVKEASAGVTLFLVGEGI